MPDREQGDMDGWTCLDGGFAVFSEDSARKRAGLAGRPLAGQGGR